MDGPASAHSDPVGHERVSFGRIVAHGRHVAALWTHSDGEHGSGRVLRVGNVPDLASSELATSDPTPRSRVLGTCHIGRSAWYQSHE